MPTPNRVATAVLLIVVIASLWFWSEQRDGPRDDVGMDPADSDDIEVMIGVEPGLEGREGEEMTPEAPPIEPAPAKPKPAWSNVPDKPVRYVIEGVVREVGQNGFVQVPLEIRGDIWETGDDGRASRRVVRVPTNTDRNGHFRVEISTGDVPYPTGVHSASPDWQVFSWYEEHTKTERVDVSENAVSRIVVEILRAFHLKGRVVDVDGNAVAKVRVQCPVMRRRRHDADHTEFDVNTTNVWTGEDGSFHVGPFPADLRMGMAKESTLLMDSIGRLTFTFGDLPPTQVDPWSIPEEERDRVEVVLHPGFVLTGVVVDEGGRPLADVPVAAEYDTWNKRRGERTDAGGRFRLEGLARGPMTLRTRAFAVDRKGSIEMDLQASNEDVRLVAEPIRLTTRIETHEVLGLGLVDVTDEIRAAYDVPNHVNVLIHDPGEDPKSLGIGRLERGYGLWKVHHEDVRNVRHAVELMLVDETGGEKDRYRRLVYTFWNERMSGSNTQHIELTDEQVAGLLDVRERLR